MRCRRRRCRSQVGESPSGRQGWHGVLVGRRAAQRCAAAVRSLEPTISSHPPSFTAAASADSSPAQQLAVQAAPLPAELLSLSAPRLLAALGLGPAVLMSEGQPRLDVEAMAGAALGSTDAGAIACRRRLAVLASLQPFLRDLPAAAAEAAAAAAPSAPPLLLGAELQRERAAAAALAAQCQAQLAALPTSAAQDAALLAEDDAAGRQGPFGRPLKLSLNVRAAVAARLERKRVLLAAVEALRCYAASLG